jgi:hypothetical protein
MDTTSSDILSRKKLKFRNGGEKGTVSLANIAKMQMADFLEMEGKLFEAKPFIAYDTQTWDLSKPISSEDTGKFFTKGIRDEEKYVNDLAMATYEKDKCHTNMTLDGNFPRESTFIAKAIEVSIDILNVKPKTFEGGIITNPATDSISSSNIFLIQQTIQNYFALELYRDDEFPIIKAPLRYLPSRFAQTGTVGGSTTTGVSQNYGNPRNWRSLDNPQVFTDGQNFHIDVKPETRRPLNYAQTGLSFMQIRVEMLGIKVERLYP